MSKDPFIIGDKTINELKIEKGKSSWVEESFESGEGSEEYVSSNFDLNKIKWLLIIVMLIFGVLTYRLINLQIANGAEFLLAAEENRIRIKEIKSPRGIIYDRNNNVLAHNIPNFILSFIPADIPSDDIHKDNIANKISEILEIDKNEISSILNSKHEHIYQSFTIEEHIPYEKALLLKIASSDLPGITLEVSSFREYLSNPNFSHIIGYMGKISENDLETKPNYSYDDYLGKSGIEEYYESFLKGVHGKKEIEVDSLGKESKIINTTQPIPGQSLVLTIDSGLQDLLSNSLNEVVDKGTNITGAAAVAINPKNGDILALVSSPTYNNNKFNLGLTTEEYQLIIEDDKKPLFNRAISGEYPSGSTIKPLIALAALDEGIITDQTSILSVGGIQINQWYFPDWKSGGHGQTNVRKALAESVNTFFYTIGGGNDDFVGLGVEKISSYLRLFGLGDRIDIDLGGEATGFLPNKKWKEEVKDERWYIGDTYHLSIGQGDILVTPLQVANYTATIANGGIYYQPHLANYFTGIDGQVTTEVEPKIVNDNILNSNHFQTVREGLREAVISGSARSLADLPVTSAGKTGTAQFGNENKTHAWFTSFAPYEDPEIVITVLVEAGGGGEAIALPIAKKGLQYWFTK